MLPTQLSLPFAAERPDLNASLHAKQAPTAGKSRQRPAMPPPPPLLGGLAEQLRQQPLFNVLPEALLAMLGAAAHLRHCSRDELAVRQGDSGQQLMVLLRGRAHAERAGAGGRVVLLDVLEPGSRIGEMALIDGQPHNANVRCVLPCDLMVLSGDDVLQCQALSARFSQAWMAALADRVRQANRRILSMSVHDVRERVVSRLQAWGEPIGTDQWLVSSRVGRTELARMVGASREMVCRVLRGLQATGVVELRHDRSILLRLRQAG